MIFFVIFHLGSATVIIDADRLALIDIFNAFGCIGECAATANNYTQSGADCPAQGTAAPNTTCPGPSCLFVSCNSAGRVVQLDCIYCALAGTHPTTISKLSFLTELDVGVNNLQGEIELCVMIRFHAPNRPQEPFLANTVF
jgi:hypothetical protein